MVLLPFQKQAEVERDFSEKRLPTLLPSPRLTLADRNYYLPASLHDSCDLLQLERLPIRT